MRRSELDHLLRKAGAVARERHFIIFGSQAIWGLLRRVPKALTASLEADLYPKTHPQAVLLIEASLGRGSTFYKTYGYYADCVTPALAIFPNGWEDRLVPYTNKATGGVTGWCVEIHDLAISKVFAGREKDLAYVKILLRHKLLQPNILDARLTDSPIDVQRRAHLRKQFRELASKNQAKPKSTTPRRKRIGPKSPARRVRK